MGGAAWSRNDVIVFPGPGGLHRVSANGGPMSRFANDSSFHLWPQFLDDWRALHLFVVHAAQSPAGLAGRRAATNADDVSRERSGLAYVSGFDPVRPGRRPVRQAIRRAPAASSPVMRAASSTEFPSRVRDVRRFQYPRPASWPSGRTRVGTPALLRWFARNGESSPAIDAPAKYFGFSLSPDGRRPRVLTRRQQRRAGSLGAQPRWRR